MEKIDTALQQLRSNVMSQQPPSEKSSAGIEQVTHFLQSWNPSIQSVVCANTKKCIEGDAPTLAHIKRLYGKNTPSAWIVPQLMDLSAFCGCKEKITQNQYVQLADIISQEYYYLKVSELMLFFWKFKSGVYGQFYGSVDPMIITTALYSFVRWRNECMMRYAGERRILEEEEEKRHCVSWQEYQNTLTNGTKTHQETFQTSSVGN